MAFLFVLSWIVPKKHWPAISNGLVSVRGLRHRDLEARGRRVGTLLQGRDVGLSPREIVRGGDALAFLEKLQLLRLYRPGGWHPDIRLEGREHIERALGAGHGAILWIAPNSFYRQVSKMAFAQAGFRVSHLSRYFHGFNSFSLFGEFVINPIRNIQEGRYLKRRVVIGRDGAPDVLERLEALLQRNELVSITVGTQGRRTHQVDFLNGKLTVATGPAYLSHRTKAPLLPVFTVLESDDRFTILVAPPVNESWSEDAAADIEVAIAGLAAQLERHALAYPAQFFGEHSRLWHV